MAKKAAVKKAKSAPAAAKKAASAKKKVAVKDLGTKDAKGVKGGALRRVRVK